MKYLFLTVFGAGVLLGAAIYLGRAKTPGAADPANSPEINPVIAQVEAATSETKPFQVQSQPQPPAVGVSYDSPTPPPAPATHSELNVPLLVESLVSAQVPFEQKRSIWKQLREEGRLDEAISGLEQRVANNRTSPEDAAALGQAYLQKCGTISDVREQGILAMQADKVFDTALSLDPSNWEARFTKAVALSYWPASMNKGEEVTQHFLTLIQQQETQPSQPQFADSYVWLGDQYQKSGRVDDARAVWERGAGLFPQNQKLAAKLASP